MEMRILRLGGSRWSPRGRSDRGEGSDFPWFVVTVSRAEGGGLPQGTCYPKPQASAFSRHKRRQVFKSPLCVLCDGPFFRIRLT